MIGSAGALVLAWAFLVHVVEIEAELSPWTVLLAGLATAVLAVVSGGAASVRALRARPLQTLR